jgi:hypothetical protein
MLESMMGPRQVDQAALFNEFSLERHVPAAHEVPSTGQPWPEFKERFARLRESVTLVRALWTQERV